MANIARRRNHYRPGAFRGTVIVQKPARTPDAQGGFTRIWDDFAELPAKFEDINGEEMLVTGGLLDREMVRVIVPKPDYTISGDDRLLENDPQGRELYIVSVTDVDNQGRYLRLLCTDTKL